MRHFAHQAVAGMVPLVTTHPRPMLNRRFAMIALELFFFVACLLSTVGIERWAIATGRWSYSDDMPVIFGVGVLPLLQWVLIPALSLLVFRLTYQRDEGTCVEWKQ